MGVRGLKGLIVEIKKQSNPARAQVSQWFFKTGKGQYGEGDVFVGLTVPQMRSIAKKYTGLSLMDIKKLLVSKIHEHRFIGLVILADKFNKALNQDRKLIVNFYLKNAKLVNNWDLVDTSAPQILGKYLLDKPRSILYKLANSKNLWEKRISIVATQTLIANKQFKETLEISRKLLADPHDLIHKAVGWMLREVGKKDEKVLLKFLNQNYRNMPRTSLRYAIERLSDNLKKHYMQK